MGSRSDAPVMAEAAKVLDEFGVSYEMNVLSAHRTPELIRKYALGAEERGLQTLIAGAGAAAHLAGVLAAYSVLPIIGVPLASSSLGGLDALFSTVQMPAGVPVASMSIGKSGAKNAALFSVQILSRSDPHLVTRLKQYREKMRRGIEAIQL